MFSLIDFTMLVFKTTRPVHKS